VDGRVAPRIADASGRNRGVGFAAASCPEFLREATGMADFYDPPFLVLGTEDPHAADVVRHLFSFLGRDLTVTDTRTAEMLKYSCNAFHALKVVFANEMGVIAKESGADAREVMRLFCTDDRLNLSPRYLSPGFAFGGSCLPKDLRGLVHQARSLDLDVPLLATVAVSNEQHVRRAVDAVIETGRRRVCLLGLSFKPGTDDLRESPQVELAERLLGKGLEVTIYDATVNPDRLVGRNQAFVAERLPHLNRLLHSDPVLALEGAGCAVVATSEPEVVEALLNVRPPRVLDLQGGLGSAVESMPGYEGIAW
jgi:GDP-mannose 6-dehydrogenase